MNSLSPQTLVTILTIIVSGVAILVGTAIVAIVEGKAVLKALDSISRQPEAANEIRTTLVISMAMLESSAIYVLLVVLILVFANPMIDSLF
jgi:F-type H+-transporting ATPase subunit c